ncbi:MAG: hypothetical protein ACO3P9_06490, partial [Phycisphaerales bacterium]
PPMPRLLRTPMPRTAPAAPAARAARAARAGSTAAASAIAADRSPQGDGGDRSGSPADADDDPDVTGRPWASAAAGGRVRR